MKRILCCILALLLLFAAVSCTKDDPDISDVTESDTEQTVDTKDDTNDSSKVETTHKKITPPGSFERVVLIVADGAGAFFQNASTPNMDEIFYGGAVTHKCKTLFPASSRANFGAMLLGVDPVDHRLDDVPLNVPWPSNSKYPTIFRVIRENDEDAAMASIINWNFMNTNMIENNLGVYKDRSSSDAGVTQKVCDYLEDNDPKMLFVQFNEPDVVGHYQGGFGSQDQLNNIAEIDSYIGKIYASYAQKGIADDTLFIVTADHGGIDNTHGGDTDGEKYVTFAVAGKGVASGEIQDMDLRDTAAIMLYALGYEAPEIWTSRVPTGVFEGVSATERPIYMDEGSPRYHENQPTPGATSKDHVTKYVLGHKLKTYLTFDGTIGDTCGNLITKGREISFEQGYFGQAAIIDHGHVTINNYTPGKDSFTVSMWIDLRRSLDIPCIMANKDADKPTNEGYALTIDRSARRLRLNVGDGVRSTDLYYTLPSDFEDGWMHILMVVDRENNRIGLSCDFDSLVTTGLPASMANCSLNALYRLNIGQDALARLGRKGQSDAYYRNLHATIDEFMIFDGAFNQADINALALYYGKL